MIASLSRANPRRRAVVLPAIAAVILIGLALPAYSHNIVAFRLSEDEGQYLYDAWRISEGDQPYRDFVTAQMPAFLYLGATLQRIAGATWVPLRIASIAATMLAAIFVMSIGTAVDSRLTGILAAAAFLAHDQVFAIARIWRSDPYMLLFVTIGLWCYARAVASTAPTLRASWAALSGLSFAAATAFKLFGLLPASGVMLYIFWRGATTRRWANTVRHEMVPFVFGFAVPIAALITTMRLQERSFLGQVLEHHLRQGAGTPWIGAVSQGARLLLHFALYQPALVVLALVGMACWLRSGNQIGRLLIAQIPTAAAFLLVKRDVALRYLVYLTPALSLAWAAVIAGLIRRAWAGRASVRGAALAMVTVALIATTVAPYVPRHRRTIARHNQLHPSVVSFIREHTSPDDLVLTDQQWINYLARRRTTRLAAAVSEGAASSGQITGARLIEEISHSFVASAQPSGGVRAVVLDFGATGHQLEAMDDFDAFYQFVQENFALVRLFQEDGQIHEVYLADDILPPGPDVVYGHSLKLTAVQFPQQVARWSEIPVLLRWQAIASPGRDLGYSVRLVDGEGHIWGQVDGSLKAPRSREGAAELPFDVSEPASSWTAGRVVLTNATLTPSPGTPPGEYHLQVSVYDAASLIPLVAEGSATTGQALAARIGTIAIQRDPVMPSASADDDLTSLAPVALDHAWPGLRLVSRGNVSSTWHPGDRFTVLLAWRAAESARPRYTARLELIAPDGGIAAVTQSLIGGAAYPTDQWRPGDLVVTQHSMQIAAEAAGAYELRLSVRGENEAVTDPGITVAELEVAGRARRFDAPPTTYTADAVFGGFARLVGYDVRQEASAVHVQLVWQALATPPLSYTVFVHVTDESGRPIAQKDAPPAQGEAPTTGWLPGEVILDEYDVTLPDSLPPGEYQLIVGFYDGQTLQRVPVRVDESGSLSDHYLLSAQIRIGQP
ncbi:MAG: hypothetical protein Kow0047_22700 [Anaerolineae bacterium]